jgi:hypothetical protein
MVPDYANNIFTHMLSREHHCTHVVLILVKVLNYRVVRNIASRNSETDLLSCLKIARKLSERSFLERDEAEHANR